MPIQKQFDSIKEAENAMRRGARPAVEAAVRAGAIRYDRNRDLHRLLRADVGQLLADTEDAVVQIVSRLERSLRAERNRAASGHWTYDLNRHIALLQAYRAECSHLAGLRDARRG